MSLVLIRPELDVWEPGEHNGTFRGNNHAFVTATARARAVLDRRPFRARDSAEGGAPAQHAGTDRAVQSAGIPGQRPGYDVRNRDAESGDIAADVCGESFSNGLIIERAGPRDEVLKCLMPLTTPDELDEGLDGLERALHDEFSKGAVAPPKAVTSRAASDELPPELHPQR